jgi:hypothetical protein
MRPLSRGRHGGIGAGGEVGMAAKENSHEPHSCCRLRGVRRTLSGRAVVERAVLRPAWAAYVCGEVASKVIPLKRA